MNKLAIGTVQFGMTYGIANQEGQVHQDKAFAILDLAWKNGIDTLDTAKSYGTSEKVIGNYLRLHPENTWNVITKFGNRDKNVADQIQDSYRELNILPTILMAHSAKLFMNPEFQAELAEANEKQIISKAGVSVYNEAEIDSVLGADFKPEVIQLPLNILDTSLHRNNVLKNLKEKGIEIHVRSAFLQGLFYLSDANLKGYFEDALPYIIRLRSIAANAGLSLSELSLLWLFSLEEVSKVVIGLDNVEQLKAHLTTLKKQLDPAVYEDALSVHYENENVLNPSLWPKKS
jgi:uncharacterized protein